MCPSFPPRFSAYHPADYETYDVVSQIVQQFARKYCHLPFPEIAIGEIPSETTVQGQFEEYQRKADKNKQKKELRMDVDSLCLIVGEKEIARFPDVEYGLLDFNDTLYAVLKDGSRHLIGRPNLQKFTSFSSYSF